MRGALLGESWSRADPHPAPDVSWGSRGICSCLPSLISVKYFSLAFCTALKCQLARETNGSWCVARILLASPFHARNCLLLAFLPRSWAHHGLFSHLFSIRDTAQALGACDLGGQRLFVCYPPRQVFPHSTSRNFCHFPSLPCGLSHCRPFACPASFQSILEGSVMQSWGRAN